MGEYKVEGGSYKEAVDKAWEDLHGSGGSGGGGGGGCDNIIGCFVLACFLLAGIVFGVDYLIGKAETGIVKEFYPDYETRAEKTARVERESAEEIMRKKQEEDQRWDCWNQFASNSDKWLKEPESSSFLPGKFIFISSPGNHDILFMYDDDKAPYKMYSNNAGKITSLALSPNGDKIIFVLDKNNEDSRIYIEDFESESTKQLADNEAPNKYGEYTELAWLSPSIVLSCRKTHPFSKTIWQVRMDRSLPNAGIFIPGCNEYNEEWVKKSKQNRFSSCESTSVSPSMKEVAYVRREAFIPLVTPCGCASRLIVRDLKDNKESVLSVNSIMACLTSQAWSPDGKRIVFSGIGYGRIGIWEISDKEGPAASVTWFYVCGNNPAWSPDGKWIAFDNNGTIYVLEIASGNVRKIVGRFSGQCAEKPLWFVSNPAIQPDNKQPK